MIKTNAMRLPDAKKVHNEPHEYDAEVTDGCAVADMPGEPRERVFKTLVTESGKGEYLVFVVPVCHEPDLKAAARGGSEVRCNDKAKRARTADGLRPRRVQPRRNEKALPHVFRRKRTLIRYDIRQRGKRGVQMEVSPAALADFCRASFAPLAAE